MRVRGHTIRGQFSKERNTTIVRLKIFLEQNGNYSRNKEHRAYSCLPDVQISLSAEHVHAELIGLVRIVDRVEVFL